MRNTEEEIELNEIDFSYYNVPLHFFELWVLLIITTIISAFSIPWLFKLLDFIIHSLWSSVKLFPVLEEGSSLIPNFLAGMLGIIIGFIFDAIYIRRMKILYDYIGIRDCIKEDLKEIVHVCIYSKGKINAAQEEMLKSKVSKYLNSIDWRSILYNIPRKFKVNQKGKIALDLQNILAALEKRNYENVSKESMLLLMYIDNNLKKFYKQKYTNGKNRFLTRKAISAVIWKAVQENQNGIVLDYCGYSSRNNN